MAILYVSELSSGPARLAELLEGGQAGEESFDASAVLECDGCLEVCAGRFAGGYDSISERFVSNLVSN